MDVIKMTNRQSRGLKFMENSIKDLSREHFGKFFYKPFNEHEVRNAYEDFRTEAFTIRGFGYYVNEVIMYTNDINICIRASIKNYFETKTHAVSIYLRR